MSYKEFILLVNEIVPVLNNLLEFLTFWSDITKYGDKYILAVSSFFAFWGLVGLFYLGGVCKFMSAKFKNKYLCILQKYVIKIHNSIYNFLKSLWDAL